MFYGLAHLEESFHQHHLLKVVTLAPCFVASLETRILLHTMQTLLDIGVYVLYGTNW